MKRFPVTGDWHGCYGKSWKRLISDASFKHPAKFSKNLIERIYRYLLDENLLGQGDTILDCFGGVALGAFHALQFGLSWLGAELEQNFVELGQENITLWESRYRGKLPNWTGQAVLLQGDSRRLIEVLRQNGIEAVVSSPPYADGEKGHPSLGSVNKGNWGAEGTDIAKRRGGNGRYGDTESQLANLPTGDLKAIVTSSPFAGNSGGRGEASRNGIDAALFDRHQGGMVRGLGEGIGNLGAMQPKQSDLKAIVTSSPFVDSVGSDDPDRRGGLYRDPKRRNDKSLTGTYGDSEGQLGAMKAGEVKSVISSPPYADTDLKTGKVNPESWSDGRARNVGVSQEESVGYGDSDGQLGAMKAGEIEAVVGSPPYENSVATDERGKFGGVAPMPDRKNDVSMSAIYDKSDGQIGATSGDTFWSAARLILEQCYLLLPGGGAAVFVCKDFIKAGERIPFSQQWAELCQAIGFVPYAHFRAWQVKPGPVQRAIVGEDMDYTKEYKSFFRRHQEKTGSPRIDWEDVLIFRKGESNA